MRAPLSVLLVVVLTLSPALLAAEAMPDGAGTLPLGSVLLAAGAPFPAAERVPATPLALLWAAVATGVAFLVYCRRPRLR